MEITFVPAVEMNTGVRIETHDFVRDRIATILNYCGIFTTTEPKICFAQPILKMEKESIFLR